MLRNRAWYLGLFIANSMLLINVDAAEFELAGIGEWVTNTQGGLDRGSDFLGNIAFTALANTEEWGLSPKGEVFVFVLGDTGGDPTERVGDIQGTSNIESPNSAKVYEFWYRHHFSEQFSLLAGLHDFNAQFYSLESAGLFINSSFGIGPDASQVGPSIFPTTSVGIITSLERENSYIYLGLYDGIPGDPENTQGTHIKFDHGDGIFSAAEFGLLGSSEHYWKLGVGIWHHTAVVQNPMSQLSENNNQGAYFIAEKKCNQDISAFMQLGYASPNKNQIAQYLGVGLSKTGLFSDEDSVGVGLATAFISREFQDLDPAIKNYESTLELTYSYSLNEYFLIKPDLQYVVNPSFSADIDNALVFTLRLESQMSF